MDRVRDTPLAADRKNLLVVDATTDSKLQRNLLPDSNASKEELLERVKANLRPPPRS